MSNEQHDDYAAKSRAMAYAQAVTDYMDKITIRELIKARAEEVADT